MDNDELKRPVPSQPLTVPHVDAQGRLQAGRYAQPWPSPRITAPWGRRKRWHYLSFSSDRYFVALALVDLGYLGNAFVYVIDRESGQMLQTEAVVPLAWGLKLATDVRDGQSRWRSAGKNQVQIDAVPGGWRVTLDLRLWPQGSARRGDAVAVLGQWQVAEDAQALALLHPFSPTQWAYTHKSMGNLAQGFLQVAGLRYERSWLVASDWTDSWAQRHTRWNWASFATLLSDGRRCGLNASAHVYQDEHGQGLENAVQIDGRLYLLPHVTMAVPDRPGLAPWRIEGDGIDLKFQPLGARQQRVNAWILRSAFVQPYGMFRGTIRVGEETLVIDDAFGVVEDHDALW